MVATRLTALILTLALGVLIISALLLVLAGSHLAQVIAQYYNSARYYTPGKFCNGH